jgi:hypothetical protein
MGTLCSFLEFLSFRDARLILFFKEGDVRDWEFLEGGNPRFVLVLLTDGSFLFTVKELDVFTIIYKYLYINITR